MVFGCSNFPKSVRLLSPYPSAYSTASMPRYSRPSLAKKLASDATSIITMVQCGPFFLSQFSNSSSCGEPIPRLPLTNRCRSGRHVLITSSMAAIFVAPDEVAGSCAKRFANSANQTRCAISNVKQRGKERSIIRSNEQV